GGRRETTRGHQDRRSCPHWCERSGVGGRSGGRDQRWHSGARRLASSRPACRLRRRGADVAPVTVRYTGPFAILWLSSCQEQTSERAVDSSRRRSVIGSASKAADSCLRSQFGTGLPLETDCLR